MDSPQDHARGSRASGCALTFPSTLSSASLNETRTRPSTRLDGMRVLIAHDWIVAWAGSERCVEQLLEVFPQADLVVGVMAGSMRDFNQVTRRAQETWLGRIPGARTHQRWFLPLEAGAFVTLDTRPYDLIISSSHAFAKIVQKRKPGSLHVCYCHSPPRYLWDLSASYRRLGGLAERVALTTTTSILRKLDRWSAARVDHFICNSAYVAERIRRLYGRGSDVVYPPVSPKEGRQAPAKRSDFLLSLGRLVGYKRVDLAIRAAETMGMDLLIAGDGPDRRRLERIAGPHTKFLGEVSEQDAARLLSTCKAFVFCGEEDFGIALLEANAHGAPVVYLRRGGPAETMRPGVTGIPFDNPSPHAVAEAIQTAFLTSWSEEQLRANAARYSPQNFREGMTTVLTQVIDQTERLGRRD